MTFGESLTYWYLRLNGFFPISRFVLHQPKGHGQSTDCDLLGVRFPNASEVIGNEFVSCDTEFFLSNGVDLSRGIVGVVTEVKTGRYDDAQVKTQFDFVRLRYAIARMGVFPTAEVESIARALEHQPFHTHQGYTLVKLVVDSNRHRVARAEVPEWLQISIEEIESFIKRRMDLFRQHKSGSWFYFEGDLIQSYAWKSGATQDHTQSTTECN